MIERSLEVTRFDPAAQTELDETVDYTNWYPTRLIPAVDGTRLAWGDLTEFDLSSESFFSRIRYKFEHGARHGTVAPGIETDLAFLEKIRQTGTKIEPTAFVMHTSHSGSTLFCKMLGASKANIAVSEPRPIKEAFDLMAPGKSMPSDVEQYLPHLIRSWGHTADPLKKNYFVKLNSYHMPYFDLLRTLFPSAKFVCLYRNPTEIIAGRLQRFLYNNHCWNVDGREYLVDLTTATDTGIVAGMVSTLECMYDHIRTSMLSHPATMAVDYGDFGEGTYRRLFTHLGIDGDEQNVADMLEQTSYHSKEWSTELEKDDGPKKFESDKAKRHKELSAELTQLIETGASESYRLLKKAAAENVDRITRSDPSSNPTPQSDRTMQREGAA